MNVASENVCGKRKPGRPRKNPQPLKKVQTEAAFLARFDKAVVQVTTETQRIRADLEAKQLQHDADSAKVKRECDEILANQAQRIAAFKRMEQERDQAVEDMKMYRDLSDQQSEEISHLKRALTKAEEKAYSGSLAKEATIQELQTRAVDLECKLRDTRAQASAAHQVTETQMATIAKLNEALLRSEDKLRDATVGFQTTLACSDQLLIRELAQSQQTVANLEANAKEAREEIASLEKRLAVSHQERETAVNHNKFWSDQLTSIRSMHASTIKELEETRAALKICQEHVLIM